MLVRRGKKSFNDFKFGTFVGPFPSDSKASTAAKGLNGHSSTQAGCFSSVQCYSGPGYISFDIMGTFPHKVSVC